VKNIDQAKQTVERQPAKFSEEKEANILFPVSAEEKVFK
jgi:hypothetical protein